MNPRSKEDRNFLFQEDHNKLTNKDSFPPPLSLERSRPFTREQSHQHSIHSPVVPTELVLLVLSCSAADRHSIGEPLRGALWREAAAGGIPSSDHLVCIKSQPWTANSHTMAATACIWSEVLAQNTVLWRACYKTEEDVTSLCYRGPQLWPNIG